MIAPAWADAAASLQEELKTATFETIKSKLMVELGDMPENKAERLVKSSEEWKAYVTTMCANRAEASRRKVQLEYVRMRFCEQQSVEANQRHEARLSRG
jgi:hypothetical protein